MNTPRKTIEQKMDDIIHEVANLNNARDQIEARKSELELKYSELKLLSDIKTGVLTVVHSDTGIPARIAVIS